MNANTATLPAAAHDVLIAGARTTGLMLAICLRRQGLSVRIIDQSPGIDPHSRAALLHSRSLELLHGMDLTEEIVANGQVLRGSRLFADGRQIMETRDPPAESPYPYAIAYGQPKIEAMLERRLLEHGVAVERDTALMALEQDAAGVRAVLRQGDGNEQTASAAWLVGCDGAHSATRKLLGVALEGDESPHRYILADVLMGNNGPADTSSHFFHDDGHFFITILDEGRRLVSASLPLDHTCQGTPDLSEMQDIADRRTGGSYPLSDPRWLSYFHIHYRLAERYRVGRVFLAGDAAHQNSPYGGHGMNTGMQDACNLAWKLTLAAKGFASGALFDSYEAERRPAAAAMIADTRGFTEPGEAYPYLSPDERREMLAGFNLSPEKQLAFRRNFEELDLDYRASPLCQEGDASLPTELRPGLEARDAPGLLRNGTSCSLFDMLDGTAHTLLVFPPAQAESQSTEAMIRTVAEDHGSWIIPYLVCGEPLPAENEEILPCLVDGDDALRQRYGMQEGGFYLLRPDGYVAYRSRDPKDLEDYVKTVLDPR